MHDDELEPDRVPDSPVTGSIPIIGSNLTPITASIPVIGPESPTSRPAPREIFGVLERIDARVLAFAASIIVGFGPVMTLLSGENAATTVLFRFGIALIPLIVLSIIEIRRNGPLPRRHTWMHLLAGTFFGIDLGLWTQGMMLSGAGVATVVGNIQVIIVPLMALALFGERLRKVYLIAIPVVLAGVVLISGVLEQGIGADVALGVLLAALSGVAYSGYVLIVSRAPSRGHAATQAMLAASTSLVVGVALASVFGAPNFTPDVSALGWLIALALGSQVVGWLATTAALPRLDSATGSTLLLMQPVTALVGGMLLLGEQISWLQWAGIAAIIASVWLIARSAGKRERKEEAPPAD